MKPTVKVVGTDGNIFAVLGKVTSALKKNGQSEEAKELTDKVFKASSYDEALCLCMEYVNLE